MFVDEVTRDYIEGVTDPQLREIRLTPWQARLWTHLSYDQSEIDKQFSYRYVLIAPFHNNILYD